MKPQPRLTMKSHLPYSFIAFLALTSNSLASPLALIEGLSEEAKGTFVAHYDSSVGVTTNGAQGEVVSWNPVDLNGNQLSNDLGLLTIQQNNGEPVTGQITQSATEGAVEFSDPEDGRQEAGQRLEGSLPLLSRETTYTIFWRGNYREGHRNERNGIYAYNLGPDTISHQRVPDTNGLGFNINTFVNPGAAGDSITRFDDQDTVWSTVVSRDSIAAFANGIDLNIAASRDRFDSSTQVTLGAAGPDGFDFVGEIRDFIIFRSALSDADRALVRAHLSPPEVVVTNTNDSGNNTLRQAVSDSPSNTLITFDPSLSGQTITISGAQLFIDKNLTIDASALPEGITITVNGQKRIFRIRPGNDVSLIGLTLTGGLGEFETIFGADINVGGAIYNDQATLRLSSCNLIGNSVTGEFCSGGAIFNGGLDGSVFLSLSNCHLSGNTATGSVSAGGAIFSDGSEGNSTMNLTDCTLSNNSAVGEDSAGGGIFNSGLFEGNAELTMNTCKISGNTAFEGGGVYNAGQGGLATLVLNTCSISNNSASTGAGIFSSGANEGIATATIDSCTITQNIASNDGGGFYSDGQGDGDSTLIFSSCTLSGNAATNGGGIYSNGRGGVSMFGGFVFSGYSGVSLDSCTLIDNLATNSGGGFYSDGQEEGNAILNIDNTILASNNAPTGPDLRELGVEGFSGLDFGARTIASGMNLISSIEGSNIDQAAPPSEFLILGTNPPHLAPLGDYGGATFTRPPLLNSPALNAAGSEDSGGTDQRGLPRFFGGMLDIGAVEFQGEDGELMITFDLDSDRDGTTNGLETALGTNPLLADAEDARNLSLTSVDSSGQPQFAFGIEDSQQNNIILRLMRSTDLMTFDQEVLSNVSGDFPTPSNFSDSSPPVEGKAFYRLEAELR